MLILSQMYVGLYIVVIYHGRYVSTPGKQCNILMSPNGEVVNKLDIIPNLYITCDKVTTDIYCNPSFLCYHPVWIVHYFISIPHNVSRSLYFPISKIMHFYCASCAAVCPSSIGLEQKLHNVHFLCFEQRIFIIW